MSGGTCGTSLRTATFGGIPLAATAHVCVFHRRREERDALLVPFLVEGAQRGNPSLYFAAEGQKGDIPAQMRDTGLDEYPDADLVEVREPEGNYLLGGRFNWTELLESLAAWSDRIFANPRAVLARVAGDMSWTKPLMSPELIDNLLRYEASVTRWVRSQSVVALCFYDLDLYGGDLIVPMVKAHPQVWMGGALVENPYYRESDVHTPYR